MGTWVSPVRQTEWGPMRFTFRIGDRGMFDVTGTPTDDPQGELYRRHGPYHLHGRRLVSPAINEGRPVEVRIVAGELILVVDETLAFVLRREPPLQTPQ